MSPQSIDTLNKGMSFCSNERDVFAFGCFQLMLSNGAVGGFFPKKLVLADYIAINGSPRVDCIKEPMASESNRLGCIASVTANAFRTYHDTLAILVAEVQNRPPPSCIDTLMLTWSKHPDRSADDFLKGIAAEHVATQTSVLAQWCDQFAPIVLLHSRTVQNRFRCCVTASGYFFVKKAFIELFDPQLVRVHCDELVQTNWTDSQVFQYELRNACLESSLIYPGGSQDPFGLSRACLL